MYSFYGFFSFHVLPQGQNRLIGGLLFRRFFGASLSFSDDLVIQHGVHQKFLIMIRPLFTGERINKFGFRHGLDHLLKHRFTVVKKNFILQIRKYKPVDKIMGRLKTAVQIQSSDNRLHGI